MWSIFLNDIFQRFSLSTPYTTVSQGAIGTQKNNIEFHTARSTQFDCKSWASAEQHLTEVSCAVEVDGSLIVFPTNALLERKKV